jgi:hypothetical protein
VIIKITDSCPCSYPGNYYSNKRWCCGDMVSALGSWWGSGGLAVVWGWFSKTTGSCNYYSNKRWCSGDMVRALGSWWGFGGLAGLLGWMFQTQGCCNYYSNKRWCCGDIVSDW